MRLPSRIIFNNRNIAKFPLIYLYSDIYPWDYENTALYHSQNQYAYIIEVEVRNNYLYLYFHTDKMKSSPNPEDIASGILPPYCSICVRLLDWPGLKASKTSIALKVDSQSRYYRMRPCTAYFSSIRCTVTYRIGGKLFMLL